MKRLGLAAVILAVIGGIGGAFTPAAAAGERLTPDPPNAPALPPSLTSPVQKIDSVVPNVQRSAIQASANYWGGTYSSAGRTVRIYLSNRYVQSDWPQGEADWITRHLLYGSELEAATFYVLTKLDCSCGSNAYGCYSPSSQTLFLPGNNDPDGMLRIRCSHTSTGTTLQPTETTRHGSPPIPVPRMGERNERLFPDNRWHGLPRRRRNELLAEPRRGLGQTYASLSGAPGTGRITRGPTGRGAMTRASPLPTRPFWRPVWTSNRNGKARRTRGVVRTNAHRSPTRRGFPTR